jgi:heat shock protein HslJ
MTDLHDLLERAAEAEPVRFTVDDVRQRVQRRRWTRRAAVGGLSVVSVLVGAVALDRHDADQVGVTADVDPPALVRRWTALYSNWIDPAPAGAHLDLRDDGTLVGSDGCNSFDGKWTAHGDQLTVDDLMATKVACPPDEDLHLVEILSEDPQIGTLGGADGTLRLQALDAGFVAFMAADPGPLEGIVETRVDVVTGPGGPVTSVFRTPRTITIGEDRQLVSWTLTNNSAAPATIWASYAIEGLATRCEFDELRRWEVMGPDLRASGRADLYPQYNLEPGDQARSAGRHHLPDGCQGDFVLVLLATSDPVDGEVVEHRVPISIR